jgi:hypothetical protein
VRHPPRWVVSLSLLAVAAAAAGFLIAFECATVILSVYVCLLSHVD